METIYIHSPNNRIAEWELRTCHRHRRHGQSDKSRVSTDYEERVIGGDGVPRRGDLNMRREKEILEVAWGMMTYGAYPPSNLVLSLRTNSDAAHHREELNRYTNWLGIVRFLGDPVVIGSRLPLKITSHLVPNIKKSQFAYLEHEQMSMNPGS